MGVPIEELPSAAVEASLRLRDELLNILGEDFVAMWLHGGTTFVDHPARPGDLDICVVARSVRDGERTPRRWRADPASRPSRIRAAQERLAGELGVQFDTTYLLAEDMGGRRLPSAAFARSRHETSWAVYRAHWLAGQYVHLFGPGPEVLVRPPTAAELRFALDRELEHLEAHVAAGDAGDPYEATYAIWNGCRILRTLATGSPVSSKRSAGAWALEHVPWQWHATIRAAGRSYDGEATTADVECLRDAMGPFVAMVRAQLPPLRRRRAGHRSTSPRWS
ncbi:MAG: DUF4111 domain-containing protein [Chloroflexi bacterium]|nr:DUF4111 domain-containing protein [Chloroflexota bacterium]